VNTAMNLSFIKAGVSWPAELLQVLASQKDSSSWAWLIKYILKFISHFSYQQQFIR
jgi:hypothetical protein